MTEVIDSGHSFISHRDHRGHRVLIWIAERAIQIKYQSSYRWKFALKGAEYLVWFLLLKKSDQTFFTSVNSGSSSDCKEQARENNEFLRSEYVIISTNMVLGLRPKIIHEKKW